MCLIIQLQGALVITLIIYVECLTNIEISNLTTLYVLLYIDADFYINYSTEKKKYNYFSFNVILVVLSYHYDLLYDS